MEMKECGDVVIVNFEAKHVTVSAGDGHPGRCCEPPNKKRFY